MHVYVIVCTCTCVHTWASAGTISRDLLDSLPGSAGRGGRQVEPEGACCGPQPRASSHHHVKTTFPRSKSGNVGSMPLERRDAQRPQFPHL